MKTHPHRILLVHNSYRHSGGEDGVAAAEADLLRARGHDVETFMRHNDDIAEQSRVRTALETVWSMRTQLALARACARFKPDIVHSHNTFPIISPSVYWAAWRARIPVVQTLHNFRLICPQAMLLRNGSVCEDCVGTLPWRAVTHGCYRESSTQSAVLATMLTVHGALGTFRRRIARYIALNDFCRDKFIRGGLPADRIMVKPNFIDFGPPAAGAERRGFLYVGRLSNEKGIAVLARAIAAVEGISLRVAGSGPERARLEPVAGASLLGSLDAFGVRSEMLGATALVVPSIWYENFPRVIVEAMASGLPIIASRIGALPDLVSDGRTGLLFKPGSDSELADRLRWAQEHPAEMERMGLNARAEFERKYAAEGNYARLMEIYTQAQQQGREDQRRFQA